MPVIVIRAHTKLFDEYSLVNHNCIFIYANCTIPKIDPKVSFFKPNWRGRSSQENGFVTRGYLTWGWNTRQTISNSLLQRYVRWCGWGLKSTLLKKQQHVILKPPPHPPPPHMPPSLLHSNKTCMYLPKLKNPVLIDFQWWQRLV